MAINCTFAEEAQRQRQQWQHWLNRVGAQKKASGGGRHIKRDVYKEGYATVRASSSGGGGRRRTVALLYLHAE
ncbi:hypothetical protein TKK_0009603 [Trichogramma kaykai]